MSFGAGGQPLPSQAAQWPTPSATSYGTNQGGAAGRSGKVRPSLETMVREAMWPTPTTRDWKDGACAHANVPTNGLLGRSTARWESGPPAPKTLTAGESTSSSTLTARRQLNPRFVEALMGWPKGWSTPEVRREATPHIALTAYASSVTESFPLKPSVPSLSSIDALKISLDVHPPLAQGTRHMSVIDDEHAERRAKVLKRTSPSALKDWSGVCERYFFFERIMGLKDPEETKAPHLKRGSHIDSEVEYFLKHKTFRDQEFNVQVPKKNADGTERLVWRREDWTGLVRAICAQLPDPRVTEVVTQFRCAVPSYPGGPVVNVQPDIVHEPRAGVISQLDVKTRSDFKYCSSAEELADDVQLVTYARGGYEVMGAGEVEFGHAYGRTGWDYQGDKPKPPRAHSSAKPHGALTGVFADEASPCECAVCKAWLSQVNRGQPVEPTRIRLSRAQVAEKWQGIVEEKIRPMVEAAAHTKNALDLPPTTSSCANIYGKPCPHRSRCGLEPKTNDNGGAIPMGNLMDRLNARKNGTSAPQMPPPGTTMTVLPAANGGPTITINVEGEPAPTPHKAAAQCDACGGELTAENISRLPNGNVKHVGCAATTQAPVILADNRQVLPPEVTSEMRTSTPEQSDAAEAKAKKRGRPKKAPPLTTAQLIDLSGKGFTAAEIDQLVHDEDAAEALEGKITPGMMRQPKPAAALAPLHQAPAQVITGDELKTTLQPSPKAQLLALGFFEAECKELFFEGAVEAALSGQIKPGPRMTVDDELRDQAKASEEQRAVIRELTTEESKSPRVERTAPGEITNVVNMSSTHIHQVPEPERIVGMDGGHIETDAERTTRETLEARETASANVGGQLHVAREKFGKKATVGPLVAPVLYVDCYPTKGAAGKVTTLEEWLAPVAELAALAAVDREGKPTPADDYRFVPYVAKGLLAAAIRACLSSLPEELAVDTRSGGADVFLEVVTPFARQVIKGVR